MVRFVEQGIWVYKRFERGLQGVARVYKGLQGFTIQFNATINSCFVNCNEKWRESAESTNVLF